MGSNSMNSMSDNRKLNKWMETASEATIMKFYGKQTVPMFNSVEYSRHLLKKHEVLWGQFCEKSSKRIERTIFTARIGLHFNQCAVAVMAHGQFIAIRRLDVSVQDLLDLALVVELTLDPLNYDQGLLPNELPFLSVWLGGPIIKGD